MGNRTSLRILRLIAFGFMAIACTSWAIAARQTKFWNITGDTIVKFELAPAGSNNWAPDQCENDKDNAVDDDERLQIKDAPTGSYDARMTFKDGRVCTVKAISIEDGKIFSIEHNQLKDCSSPQ
jgi:hypothetical protein